MRVTLDHMPARQAIAADEALLAAAVAAGEPRVRWWRAASGTSAIVLGLGLRHRVADIVDAERAAAAGVPVLERQAGGGALLLDQGMLCGAIAVPLPNPGVGADLTESYRWLGDWLVERLGLAGIAARRLEVAEARGDLATWRARAAAEDAVARLLLAACYGALSPHEIVDARGRKLVGLAQVRRRAGALFQVGVLLRDQSALADLLRLPDEATRERLRGELARRTVGVKTLTRRSTSAVVAAIADATPFAP